MGVSGSVKSRQALVMQSVRRLIVAANTGESTASPRQCSEVPALRGRAKSMRHPFRLCVVQFIRVSCLVHRNPQLALRAQPAAEDLPSPDYTNQG